MDDTLENTRLGDKGGKQIDEVIASLKYEEEKKAAEKLAAERQGRGAGGEGGRRKRPRRAGARESEVDGDAVRIMCCCGREKRGLEW